MLRDVIRRDRQDSEREIAPLRPSEDGVLVDSTGKSIEDVVEEMFKAVKTRNTEKL
ncbi:MAG: (d)CMP kinase [Syntrophaceae bacterium]